jgi:hypothetical protein
MVAGYSLKKAISQIALSETRFRWPTSANVSGSSRAIDRPAFGNANFKEVHKVKDPWAYQIRIYLDDRLAEVARHEPGNLALKPLTDILAKHGATMKCQYDAFTDYVVEAEKHGVANYSLYEWTKATINDPEKKNKYVKSFTLYVQGNEVYSRELAEALESDLQPLVRNGLITKLSKHDTNPANNPQPPAGLRK